MDVVRGYEEKRAAPGLDAGAPEGVPGEQADDWRGALLCATVVAVALVYSFRLTSFLHAKEAVLNLGLCAIAFVMVLSRRSARRGLRAFAPFWGGLMLTAVIGLTLAPARVPARVAEEAVRLASLLLMASLAYDLFGKARWRRGTRKAVIGSAVAVAALGIAQYLGLAPFLFPRFEGYAQRVYSVFGNQDLFGGYLVIAVPLLVTRLVRRCEGAHPAVYRESAAYVGLAVLLAGLLLSGSRSAWLAAAIGIAVGFPYGRVAKGRLVRLLGVAMSVLAVTLIFTWPESYRRVVDTFSARDVGGNARLWFWDGTLRMIRAEPWCGVGLGNYEYWSPRYLGEALHTPGGERHFHNELHTLHAHSEPLEFLAETGLLGALFGLWMAGRLVGRRGPEWGALAALGVFCLFNAGLHSAAHALAGLLLAAMLMARRDSVPRPPADRRLGTVLLAGAVLLGLAHAWTVLIPSHLLSVAEDVHVVGGDPLPLYERVLRHGWPNARAHEQYGMALMDAGRTEEAYDQFTCALRGLDTGSVYLFLGIAAAELGDESEARRRLEACLHRWPGNHDAWYGLCLLTPETERESLEAFGRRWGLGPQAASSIDVPAGQE